MLHTNKTRAPRVCQTTTNIGKNKIDESNTAESMPNLENELVNYINMLCGDIISNENNL